MKTRLHIPCLILLAFGLLFPVPLRSQSPQAQAVAEFKRGAVQRFSTLGHPKANGITLTLQAPRSWTLSDDQSARIVHKFTQPSTGDGALLTFTPLTQLAGTRPTEQEILSLVSPESVIKVLPAGTTVISSQRTTIAGRPGCLLEHGRKVEAGGLTVHVRMVDYVFLCDTTLVHFLGSVASTTPAEAATLPQRVAAMKPLYQLMADSITIAPARP